MDEEKKLTISIKEMILQALDNTFPGWRKNNKENNQM